MIDNPEYNPNMAIEYCRFGRVIFPSVFLQPTPRTHHLLGPHSRHTIPPFPAFQDGEPEHRAQLRALPPEQARNRPQPRLSAPLTPSSIGSALVDTLDTFIAERRIEPQVALQLLLHFDRNIAEVLGEKVKARMTFKVRLAPGHGLTRG